MHVVFRTDASDRLGLGHVMRCMALAQALMANGATTSFVVRHLPPSVRMRLLSHGIQVLRIETTQEDPAADARLGVSARQDAQDTRRALGALPAADWLVVDHYALDAAWETSLRDTARRIAVIDDLDDRPHDCDLLLDPNPDPCDSLPERRYARHVAPSTLRLLGPRYALLRPEFSAARALQPAPRRKLRRVLVSFGGGDPAGVTAFVLAALAPLAFEGFSLDVVLGAAANTTQVAKSVAALPNARLHVDVSDMTALYLSADLAVGAAGTSAWERCAVALPTILLTLADNQRKGAEALAALGGAIHLGQASAESIVALTGLVRALAHSPDWLSVLSQQAAAVCDGVGAVRVAARMESFDMHLRPAALADANDLLVWRNHELNRLHAADPAPISRARHLAKLRQSIKDPAHVQLIAEDQAGAVGVLRYDIHGSHATVSVYLVPGRHGQGRGGVLLLAGERWLQENRPDVCSVDARIMVDNVASMNVFLESGYQPDSHYLTKRIDE